MCCILETNFMRKFAADLSLQIFLRACLHGGGGPQIGEVTCLAVIKN